MPDDTLLPMDPGSPIRLIQSRIRMKRAMLAIQAAEIDCAVTGFAGSEAARDVYAEQVEAARELVSAQEAFDAHCAAKAVNRILGGVPAPEGEQ